MTTDSGGGIVATHSKAAFNLRNINTGKINTKLTPIPFADGTTQKMGYCPSMTQFTAQDCQRAKTLDGRSFYFAVKGSDQSKVCSIADKCEGAIKSSNSDGTTAEPIIKTYNMYQAKEEKGSHVDWIKNDDHGIWGAMS